MSDILKRLGRILVKEDFEELESIAGNLDEARNGPVDDAIEMIEEIENHLWEAINLARQLSKMDIYGGNPAEGQLKSYFIPWIRKFMEDTNQPGSMAAIRRMIEKA